MASLVPTEEKSDCFRLQLLIVDFGTLVLRHTFDQIVQPQPLKDFLRKSRGKLDILFKRKVISNEQWNLLFPQIKDPDSENFDVSLICCLLLNICGLNSQQHPPGWIPSSMDTSKEADITRLRQMRNNIAHLQNMAITKNYFQISWAEMEKVMLRLGAGIPNLQQDILTLKNASIDPAKENEYQKIIEQWEQMDITNQKHMDEINLKLEKNEEDIGNVKQELENAKRRTSDICDAVTVHDIKLGTIEKKQIGDSTRIDQLDDESLEHRSKLALIEKKQKTLELNVKETSISLTTMAANKLHPRLQNLATITELYTKDCARDDVYVETTAHENAKEILLNTGCVILIGPPGEGKTTLATKLLSETSQKGTCLKLSLPTDWDNIDINKGRFDTIFIDDIFGAGTLDENLLNGWSLRCKDIEKALQANLIRIIITSRHYIYLEAKTKLGKCSLFKDDNTQLLASFNLTDSERKTMIKKHLQHAEKELSSERIEECCEQYKNAFSKNDFNLPSDLEWYLQQQGKVKAMIGFPEIVSLFAKNDSLFQWNSYFFSRPCLFFKKCIAELFIDEEKFLVLILIWTRSNKELHLKSISPDNISKEIKETALKFGIDLRGHIVRVLLKSAKYHKNGFIQFNEKTGVCSFTHNTVKDMVGLVAGQNYPNAVIEYADEQFIIEYVTTDKTKDDGFHILVHEYQYAELLKAICKHMKAAKVKQFFCFSVKNRDFKINLNFGRVSLEFVLHDELNINTSLLKHDCFDQLAFVEKFCESKNGKHFMSKPVEILPRVCTDLNCDVDFGCYIPVYLPSLALLYEHKLLLNLYFERKLHLAINETSFLRTNLLIASHQGMKDVIEMLLEHGAVVCEVAIYFAAAKGHVDCLECLLKNRNQESLSCSYSPNGNSPLIAAAKRGSAECVKLLLCHGADINYRNKHNWSALDKAVLYLEIETCKILLEHKACVNLKGGKYKRTPLHLSADMSYETDITELLLKYGASITATDYRGHYPIHSAALKKYPSVKQVELLLKADVSRVTLKRRISYGKKSVIKGADLFHIAVFRKSERLVDLLLKYGVTPNVKDFYGQTPFFRAIANCEQKIFSSNGESGDSFNCILKEVMDVIFKVRPVKENTHYMTMEIIKKLLPVADVTTSDRHGYTPLHVAVHKGLMDVVKLLCPKVNVNARDKFGKTPLHTACDQLDLDIFTLLVEDFSADYRMLTKSGQSVFDILQKRTSWKNICRRYRDKKPVQSHMLEKPPFKSFRKVIAAKDPEFARRCAEFK